MHWPKERIRTRVSEALREGGFRLLDLKLGSDRRVTVILDDEASLPVTVEDCVKASRLVTQGLVEEGIERGEYHLDVLSPGVDRLLVSPDHFERFSGNRVTLITHERESSGRSKYTGLLLRGDSGAVSLKVDGREVTFDRANVAEIRVKL